jgi:hypothetical protein
MHAMQSHRFLTNTDKTRQTNEQAVALYVTTDRNTVGVSLMLESYVLWSLNVFNNGVHLQLLEYTLPH